MYIVTGGCGFIGSNIVAALCEAGEDVIVCDWLRADLRWKNIAKHPVQDLISPTDLMAHLKAARVTRATVIHMGAISDTTETDVDQIIRHNVRATLDLVEWCIASDSRLIYASSAATYGNGNQGFVDDASPQSLACLRPLNPYGWSKHFVDVQMARRQASGAPLPRQWVGLKFFNVYGPNEYHKAHMRSLVARAYTDVFAGKPIRLFRSYRTDYGDGQQLRDFIYVLDVVAVVQWFLDNETVNGIFNVGTGASRSWLDLARALQAAAGQHESIEFIDMPAELRDKYQYFTQAEMTKLTNVGYRRPFMSLEAGVKDYVHRYLRGDDPYR